MPGTLRFILGDQLSLAIASLADLEADADTVLLCEVMSEATYVPHHPKKVAFLFSAMRHFADLLASRGVRVRYVRLEDEGNSQNFTGELLRAVAERRPDRIVVTEPGEWRVQEDMRGWAGATGLPVEIRVDDRFFCSRAAFARWAGQRRQWRMEFFYRELRKQTGLLMEGPDEPAGGRWNYDVENRRAAAPGSEFAGPLRFAPDAITRDVLALVERRFGGNFGDLEPFWFATTAADAHLSLEHFIKTSLADFGSFQDAMLQGEAWLSHSVLSQYLNAGLLLPREVCSRVELAWRQGAAPLNSVEGYIRQILGWREYVRGVYWHEMPGYAALNRLGNARPLPDFYWTGQTAMNCLHQVISQTRREAHSHHIQRLMVTGNFALLADVVPTQICLWYLAVYADAYDWVELPNTLGMTMYADAGQLGSKPYAASGNYINKMSDFCRHCHYDVARKIGERACPFNYLYWNFLIEHQDQLASNPRLVQIYKTLARMPTARRLAIQAQSRAFLDAIPPWQPAAYS